MVGYSVVLEGLVLTAAFIILKIPHDIFLRWLVWSLAAIYLLYG